MLTIGLNGGTAMAFMEADWFDYGTWRFFIQFVSPLAVAAIIIAVFFFGVDFS